jgi:flagellar basal-body rod modification protein FlgD
VGATSRRPKTRPRERVASWGRSLDPIRLDRPHLHLRIPSLITATFWNPGPESMNLDTSNRTLANSFEAPGLAGPASLTDPSGAQMTGRKPNRTLGQDDFFKLIAAQFSYQDPLNPQKDTDFIAQMAQFNTLDQTRLMQADIAGLRSQFKGSQANQFLGQWVSLQDPATQRTVEGLVTEVRFNGGNPQLVVGEVPYDLSRVTVVRAPEIPDVTPAGTDALPKADSSPSLPLSATELKLLPKKLGQILGSIAR